jgi:hypothetical protein
MKMLIDILGWVGSAEVIAAYGLNSYQKLNSNSNVFQFLNLTGAVFLIANTVYYGAFPSAVINIVWVIIAAIALIRNWRKSQKQ